MNKKSILLNISKSILSFIIFLLTLIAILSVFAQSTVLNKKAYTKAILSVDLDNAVLKDVYNAIDEKGDMYALDSDTLYSFFNEKSMVEFSHSHIELIIDSVLHQKKYSTPIYNEPDLKEKIKSALESASLENEEVSEEELNEFYDSLNSTVNSSLRFLPEKYIKAALKISPLFRNLNLLTKYYPIIIVVDILFISLFVFMHRKSTTSSIIYKTITPIWFAGAIISIPTLMIHSLDTAARIPLVKNSLYYVLTGTINSVINGLLFVSTILFIAATVTLLASTAFMVFKPANRHQPSDTDL